MGTPSWSEADLPTLGPPSSPRPPNSVLSLPAVLPREVIMLAIATTALLVLATTAEASTTKYDYGGHDYHGSYEPSHEHKGDYYHEPSHESYYADQDSSHRPHHESYGEDHYGGDAYSVEPSYTHEPRYRHRRSAPQEAGVTESQAMGETLDMVDGLREGLHKKKCKIPMAKPRCCWFCKMCINEKTLCDGAQCINEKTLCDGEQFSKCKKLEKKCSKLFHIDF